MSSLDLILMFDEVMNLKTLSLRYRFYGLKNFMQLQFLYNAMPMLSQTV